MNAAEGAPVSAGLLYDPQALAARLQSQRAGAGAKEFEAALFSQVLEKMEKNASILDDESNDAGHDSWTELGVHALSQGLAQHPLLGIAGMIEHSLGIGSEDSSTAGKVPGADFSEDKSSAPLRSLKLSPTLPIHTSERKEKT
jgi:Rod binding domain-containing protein